MDRFGGEAGYISGWLVEVGGWIFGNVSALVRVRERFTGYTPIHACRGEGEAASGDLCKS
mgnify:CR=1 FL=1